VNDFKEIYCFFSIFYIIVDLKNEGGIFMWKEFKEFAVKGNVIDLAVGVIIGGAFGKIVTSLVADIIMPIISLITSGVDFKELKYVLRANSSPNITDGVTLNYGAFIQNIFDFLIVSFSIFMFIKIINKLKKKEEEKKVAALKEEIVLLQEIRDLLKNKNS
jgi:large conductance mechanosensitive channel